MSRIELRKKITLSALVLGLAAGACLWTTQTQAWTLRFGQETKFQNQNELQNQTDTWVPITRGIDFMRSVSKSPLQKVCVLRVDTQEEGIHFYTNGRYPDFQDGDRETERTTTVEFLEVNHLAAAVNANFYTPFNAGTRTTKGPSGVTGLAISEGVLVSTSDPNFPAFTVSSNGVCSIKVVQPQDSLEGIRTAVAGNMIVLQDGKVVKQDNQDIHPRTAVGISQDNHYVYLMTIDGRQPLSSVGATYEEVGAWLLKFGAYNGLNLDGGGSTTMVIRAQNGKSQVLNTPIGNANIPGYLRHNGNHLGVRLDSVAP